MSVVTPQTLPSSSGAWHGSYEYRHRTSIIDYEIYSLWNLSTSAWIYSSFDQHSIKVGVNDNVWSDYGVQDPVTVSESGTSIQLYDAGSSLLYSFTKPISPSWISSGGGGGGSSTSTSKKVFCNFW